MNKTKNGAIYYTALEWSSDGKPYRIYLGKEPNKAKRWLSALEGVTATREAEERIKRLRNAKDEDEERCLLEEMIPPVCIPEVTRAEAALELYDLFEKSGFVDYLMLDGGKYADGDWATVFDDWIAARTPKDVRDIVVELGFDRNVWEELYYDWFDLVRCGRLNPYYKNNPDPAKLEKARAKANRWERYLLEEFFGDKVVSDDPTLSACLELWSKTKESSTNAGHIDRYAKRFRDFINYIDDRSVSTLKRSHFYGYLSEVRKKQRQKDYTNKWLKDQLTPIAAILSFARQQWRGDCPFPEGLSGWLELLKDNTHRINS